MLDRCRVAVNGWPRGDLGSSVCGLDGRCIHVADLPELSFVRLRLPHHGLGVRCVGMAELKFVSDSHLGAVGHRMLLFIGDAGSGVSSVKRGSNTQIERSRLSGRPLCSKQLSELIELDKPWLRNPDQGQSRPVACAIVLSLPDSTDVG